MADRCEAHVFCFGDAADESFSGVAEYVVVDAGSVADFAAEELMDRGVEVFAHDVPECDIDCAESTHDGGAAEVGEAVHVLPVVFDA